MSYLQSIILGIVQGVAEFLPISSSGHLVLAEALLGHKGANLVFNVILHIGTLFSIFVIFRKEIWGLVRQPHVVAAIVIATLPVAVVGLLLHDWLEQAFGSTLAVGVALCVTAGLLWSTHWIDRGEVELANIRWTQALVVGLFQAVAPVPGISRSGVTIFAGLLAGLNRQTAATFSFLIAIPAILGAATLETWSVIKEGSYSHIPWDVYSVGAITAFVVGVSSLSGLLKVVVARKLYVFGWYCGVIGLIAIAASLVGGAGN